MKPVDIIDFFLPEPDIRKRHSIEVEAPSDLVYETACNFDIESVALVRSILRLREIIMGSKNNSAIQKDKITPLKLLDKGWGKLAEKHGHYLIAGASCQPWKADVVFTPIEPDQFKMYSDPNHVKIVWTLETEFLAPNQTRLSTETRVVATDKQAYKKFRQYWRLVKFGIIAIRWMLLPAIRREVMRQSDIVKT